MQRKNLSADDYQQLSAANLPEQMLNIKLNDPHYEALKTSYQNASASQNDRLNALSEMIAHLEKIFFDRLRAWNKPERFLHRHKPLDTFIIQINSVDVLLHSVGLTLKDIYTHIPKSDVLAYKDKLSPILEQLQPLQKDQQPREKPR